MDAALRMYGDRGWSGLTIRGICELAGVGRSSIYTRWSSLDELLTEAFAVHITTPPPNDAGFREKMIAEARNRAESYLGEYRTAIYRLTVEGRVGFEPVVSIFRHYRRTETHRLLTLVESAVTSGEVPPGSSVSRILDRVEGAVMVHVQSATTLQLDEVRRGIDEYISDLVDDVLEMERRRVEMESENGSDGPGSR